MTDATKNVTFQDDVSIVGTFASVAQKGGADTVAPEIAHFVSAVPNGTTLLQQFAETYASFRQADKPGADTPAAGYLGGFIGNHIAVAREINISAMNAGQGALGQQVINAVSAHVDAKLAATPATPTPRTPGARKGNRLTA